MRMTEATGQGAVAEVAVAGELVPEDAAEAGRPGVTIATPPAAGDGPDARIGGIRKLLGRLTARASESKLETVRRRLRDLRAEVEALEATERGLAEKLGPLAAAEAESAVVAEALGLPAKDQAATRNVETELARVRTAIATKRAALGWLEGQVPLVEHAEAAAAIQAAMPAYAERARALETRLEAAAEAWRALRDLQAELNAHGQTADLARDRVPADLRDGLTRPTAAVRDLGGLVAMYAGVLGPGFEQWKATRARLLGQ